MLVYNTHFSGLESYGSSGMSILDELIDKALQACEKGFSSIDQQSRGACVLAADGKVYTGCDVHTHNVMDGT